MGIHSGLVAIQLVSSNEIVYLLFELHKIHLLIFVLIVETKTQVGRICGVITAKEVIARQGDGQNYSPSFKDSLHAGTEFDVLESRLGWIHIKLFDDSDAWIPSSAAELI